MSLKLTCGKVPYPSKTSAKRARREIGDSALRPYKCALCKIGRDPTWHLGHLPARIIQGRMTRSEVYRPDAPQ